MALQHFRVTKTGNQDLGASGWVDITWPSVEVDADGMWNTTNSYATVPSEAGTLILFPAIDCASTGVDNNNALLHTAKIDGTTMAMNGEFDYGCWNHAYRNVVYTGVVYVRCPTGGETVSHRQYQDRGLDIHGVDSHLSGLWLPDSGFGMDRQRFGFSANTNGAGLAEASPVWDRDLTADGSWMSADNTTITSPVDGFVWLQAHIQSHSYAPAEVDPIFMKAYKNGTSELYMQTACPDGSYGDDASNRPLPLHVGFDVAAGDTITISFYGDTTWTIRGYDENTADESWLDVLFFEP